MFSIILHKLFEDECDSSRADPLSGMNTTINPHSWLTTTSSLAHLGNDHVTSLMGLANGFQGYKVIGVLKKSIVYYLTHTEVKQAV